MTPITTVATLDVLRRNTPEHSQVDTGRYLSHYVFLTASRRSSYYADYLLTGGSNHAREDVKSMSHHVGLLLMPNDSRRGAAHCVKCAIPNRSFIFLFHIDFSQELHNLHRPDY